VEVGKTLTMPCIKKSFNPDSTNQKARKEQPQAQPNPERTLLAANGGPNRLPRSKKTTITKPVKCKQTSLIPQQAPAY
jgi:hypothetical protein